MSVTDEAIVRIRELITSGRISPGDRLPPEQELAVMLGISRSSLREAVKALSQAKVLDVRRGDGTYVTSLEPELLLSGMSVVVDLMQDSTLVEVFEVRKLLEPAATALAAQRISDAEVQSLRDSLQDLRSPACENDAQSPFFPCTCILLRRVRPLVNMANSVARAAG